MFWTQHMMNYGWGGWLIWMIIFGIIIIGGSIWLLATIFPKTEKSSERRTDTDDDPLTILKQRYARGEVSKEEFETIRQDLGQA